jgi:hypothetical protein
VQAIHGKNRIRQRGVSGTRIPSSLPVVTIYVYATPGYDKYVEEQRTLIRPNYYYCAYVGFHPVFRVSVAVAEVVVLVVDVCLVEVWVLSVRDGDGRYEITYL